MSRKWMAVMLLAVTVAAGCLARPRVFRPGPERVQQTRAEMFEFYPENDFGPRVQGGRPREYMEPRAEVLRVQPRQGEPVLAPPGR